MQIGKLLKQAREQRNMTQEELAHRVGRKRSYISRIENEDNNITLKTLIDIVERGLGSKININF